MQYKFGIDKLTEPETVKFEAKKLKIMKKISMIVTLSLLMLSCSKSSTKTATVGECYFCTVISTTSTDAWQDTLSLCGFSEGQIELYKDTVKRLYGPIKRTAECHKYSELYTDSCWTCHYTVTYLPKGKPWVADIDKIDTLCRKKQSDIESYEKTGNGTDKVYYGNKEDSVIRTYTCDCSFYKTL